MYKYFKKIGDTENISEWKSKRLPDELIKPPSVSNKIPIPQLSYLDAKIKVQFDGSCLKQNKITYTHGTIVNIYIVYEFYTTIGKVFIC